MQISLILGKDIFICLWSLHNSFLVLQIYLFHTYLFLNLQLMLKMEGKLATSLELVGYLLSTKNIQQMNAKHHHASLVGA